MFLYETPYPVALPKRVKGFVQIPLGNNIFVGTLPGDLKGLAMDVRDAGSASTVALLQIVPTLLLITVLCFVLVRLLPGDPASPVLGDRATDADIARLRHELGLDRPIVVQFWLSRARRHAAPRRIRSRCMRR